MVDFSDTAPADALIAEIFKRQPKLEDDLAALARGY